MKIKKVKIIVLIGLYIVSFLLAIPSFSLNIGDFSFKFPDLNLSLAIPDTSFGDFKKGYGIYPNTYVKAKINSEVSESEANYIFNVISQRTKLSGIGAQTELFKNQNDYYIKVTFLEDFSNYDLISSLLFTQSNFNFYSQSEDQDQQFGLIPIDLSVKDISGNVQKDYISDFGTHLVFSFKDEKFQVLQNAFSIKSQNNTQFFILLVDQIFSFFVLPDSVSPLKVRAIPSLNIATEKEKQLYLSIIESFFAEEKPLEYTFSTELKTQPPLYSFSGSSIIAISFIFSFVLVLLILIRKIGIRKSMVFSFYYTYSILFSIVIFKIVSINLSISSVIAFILFSILSFYFVVNLLKNINSTKLILGSIFMFILAESISQSKNYLTDFNYLMIFGLISSFFLFSFVFPTIYQYFKNA